MVSKLMSENMMELIDANMSNTSNMSNMQHCHGTVTVRPTNVQDFNSKAFFKDL